MSHKFLKHKILYPLWCCLHQNFLQFTQKALLVYLNIPFFSVPSRIPWGWVNEGSDLEQQNDSEKKNNFTFPDIRDYLSDFFSSLLYQVSTTFFCAVSTFILWCLQFQFDSINILLDCRKPEMSIFLSDCEIWEVNEYFFSECIFFRCLFYGEFLCWQKNINLLDMKRKILAMWWKILE